MNGRSVIVFHRRTPGGRLAVRLTRICAWMCPLVLCGCMQYFAVKPDEQATLLRAAERPIRVGLRDSSLVFADAHHYVQVDEPANFVFVSGNCDSVTDRREREFIGRIQPSKVDTLMNGTEVLYRFRTPGYPGITCRPEDCVFVDSSGGTGLWVAGIKRMQGASIPFRGKIAPGEMTALDNEKSNQIVTTLAIIVGMSISWVGLVAIAYQ